MFHLLILSIIIMKAKQIDLLEQAYSYLVSITTSLLEKENDDELSSEISNIIDVRVLLWTALYMND